jgi:hypothetical protein
MMDIRKEVMLVIKPSFQKFIFQKIINKFGSSIKAEKYLKIPASSIRGYKNLYFKCVPNNLILNIIKLNIVSSNEVNKNIISTFIKEDKINHILNLGRKKRKEYFINLKNKIPSVKELVNNGELDFQKWFYLYQPLLESGFRKITYKEVNNYLIINYSNFAKTEFKDFEIKIPCKLCLDEDFIYFFGLWCGDRAGGKRFGVCNKNKEVLNFVESFLKKYHQKIEKILYIKKTEKDPPIKYNKKFIINKEGKGWVLSIHSNNGILTSFFYYLLSNIEEFLFLTKNKNIFLAGLFDAEGNVSLYNKSFRWACKNQELIQIYTRFLKELKLYSKYDGCCLISYNLKFFYKKILPFMKHSPKINKTRFLFNGECLPIEYFEILKYIKNNPNKTNKEISKALKKNKVYSELYMLTNFNFISFEGYPFKFKITNKGLKSLGA